MISNDLNSAIVLIDMLNAIKANDLIKTKASVTHLNDTVDFADDKTLTSNAISPHNFKDLNESYFYMLENLKGINHREEIIWRAKLFRVKDQKSITAIKDFLQSYIDVPKELNKLSFLQISDLIALALESNLWEQLQTLRSVLETLNRS